MFIVPAVDMGFAKQKKKKRVYYGSGWVGPGFTWIFYPIFTAVWVLVDSWKWEECEW